MKSLLIMTAIFIFSSSLQAGDTLKQSELASDMRKMLQAVNQIQTAGFYYNKEGMTEGVNKLKSAIGSLTTTDARSYLPANEAYADKFAQKRAKMITMYADDMIVSLNNENIDDAIEDYSQIIRQCTSCHSRIRANAWKLK
ncbi:hypothetical protein MLC52_00965 [Sulfurimonas sp. NW15]|uniref:hypothetical protein n=1 Tax=unclassified Sulfurimonas TaxID=2623549 RepID=UPI0032048CD5